MLGKVSSSMMGTFGALLEIILILYPKIMQLVLFLDVFIVAFNTSTDKMDCK